MKWLIQLLNSVLTFYSWFWVNDSFTFFSIIRQLSPYVDSQFIVYFDITSLFSNVHLYEEISISRDFLYRSPLTCVPSFPESAFVESMELNIKSFSFKDTMYCQVDGISMGSPLGHILANIFVGFYEKLLLTGFPSLLFIHVTWMITLLVLVHVMKLFLFFYCLNDLHPSLTFTMNEAKNKLPFLDALVEGHSFAFVACI